jgi:hypothetical protein
MAATEWVEIVEPRTKVNGRLKGLSYEIDFEKVDKN